MTQILIQVRSRLLDFALGLQDQLGDAQSDQELKERSKTVDTPKLFNATIYGDNNTLILGSDNRLQLTNVNIKGDFGALSDELRQHGLADEDIAALQKAVAEDEGSPELARKQYGPGVKAWFRKMLDKAVDTSWQVELGVAGNLLAAALQRFYGWL